MPERFQLPPLITASSWPSVAESIWTQNRRGSVQDEQGDLAPKWTNREAVAVIAALRDIARSLPDGFPLWYQLAAAAYDWEPATYKDHLMVSAEQADAIYPAEAAVLLNRELVRITNALDQTRGARPDPRMQLDDVFDDNQMMSDVMQALHEDGSRALFKIPLPACKGADGKPAAPVWDRSERRWKCPGGVITIDDPITALLKSLVKPAIVIGLVYVLATGGAVALRKRRRQGRRRRR